MVAALGGFGSLLGALLAERTAGRFGLGRLVVASLLFAALGNLLIPLAPAGLPLVAVAFLVGQQLIGDTAVTMYDVTEISMRQARVEDRHLGRVNATVRVVMVLAQLFGTVVGGLVAEAIGLRVAAFIGAGRSRWSARVGLYLSPVWRVRGTPGADAAAGRRQPAGRRRQSNSAATKSSGSNGQQVLRLLPHPDEPHRDAQLLLDREHDAALRRRVELRQDDAGQPDGLVERLRLREAVLAGRRVEHEEGLHARARDPLVDDAADLGQLVHQVRLRVEAAGGVRDEDVGVAGDGGVERVEHDGGRVGVGRVRDDLRVRCAAAQIRSWSIAAARKVSAAARTHAPAVRALARGQLADGRRLAGAVDADDEDDRGRALGRGDGLPVRGVAGGQQAGELGADGLLGRRRRAAGGRARRGPSTGRRRRRR